jgi:uncharacterized protein (DUF2141 family)
MKKMTCLSFLLLSLLAVLLMLPSLSVAYDVSGTVSYAGVKSGRIYLTLSSDRGHPGTSIASPGSFTIRGVPAGQYVLQAYMDTANGGVRLITSPAALPQPVQVTNANVTGQSVTLTDPPPVISIPAPTGLSVLPGDGGALVFWEGNNMGSGGQAESFNLFWSTSPLVSPTNYTGSKTNVPYASATDKAVVLSGLANGTQLYFVSTAKLGTLESAASPVIGPLTIGNPAGSYAVSGTISFPTVANTVPLYLALVLDNQNGPPAGGYLQKHAGPLTSPVSFTISGVANGNYRLYSILDNNNNGIIDTGDYMTADAETPLVTVNGAGVSNVTATLTNKAANVDIRTNHWKNVNGQGYVLNFDVTSAAKRPVSITLTSGPHVTGPIDVGQSESGEFYNWVDFGSTVPVINDTYTFDVVNSDASTATVTGKVTGVLNSFATPTAPIDTIIYTVTPTFSWSAPSSPPPVYSYRLEVDQNMGGRVWESNDIPSGQTSAIYNFDGRATSPSLADATAYTWNLLVTDPLGNMAMTQASFAFPGAPLSITTSALPPANQSVPYSQQIATQGGTLPFSWSVTNGTLPQGISLDGVTGLLSGTPTASGSFPFTVQVTDASAPPQTASHGFTLEVTVAPPLDIVTQSLPSGLKGVPYSQQIAVSGGVPPYSFTSTGTLPTGLSLNSTTGQLSGTPTASGTFDFTVQVSDSASATASQPFTVTIADQVATMTFGGVYRLTKSDGSQWDSLDLGTSLVATAKGGLNATVSGPGGFSYSFTDADIMPYLNGQLAFNKQYPATSPLAQGVYTFTLDDGQGHVYNRVDLHAGPKALPLVDSTTIKLQRKADGGYRARWAGVNDAATYSYRLRVQTAAGVPVYLGPRKLDAADDIPANLLVDGTAYQVRVEAQDSASPVFDVNQNLSLASYDLMYNRSNSSFANFTPQAADYNANRLLLRYANANTQVEADASQAVVLGFGTASTADTAVMTAASVTGPGNFSYTFNLTADKQANGIDFLKSFPAGTLTAGIYTFHVTANGLEHLLHATLTAPVVYPSPDSATYRAEDLGNGSIRLSWADINSTGALYYRAQLRNETTGMYITTPRQNQTFVDIPKGNLAPLGDLASVKWRVEVFDSLSTNTQRNRRNGPWSPTGVLATSALPPYDAGKPVMSGFGITSEQFPNGTMRSNLWLGGADSDGTITELRVDGPNGYTRNLLTQGVVDGGLYRLFESGPPVAGLYTFTVKDNAGKTAVRYNYQPAAHNVPVIDFKTVRLSSEPGGSLRISWAPVASDVPLWYGVFLLAPTDNDGNGYVDSIAPPTADFNVPINKTSVVIPAGAIPAGSWLIRIKAQDGGNFTTYNNMSRSVTFKSEGAGFNYASLTDADGDGFASNIDSNDNDPAIYPFSPPAVSSTVPAANATGVAVNTVVSLTFNQPVDNSTLNNFELKAGSSAVAGSGSYSDATKTFTFTPSAPLAKGTLYTATISGVESMTGGKMAAPFSFSFTTVAADTTPPTVVGYTPQNGATGVPVTTQLTITFSEPINTDTLPDENAFLKTGTTFIPGSGSYNNATNTATFTPTSPLAYGTVYTATLSGVKDLAGNTLASPLTLSFTTATNVTDTSLPVVTAFIVPGTSNSLTVPVNSLTAADNVAVTGYFLSESKVKPLPSAAGWSAGKPATFTFAAPGAKVVYAYAKDAAGNVSNGLAAKVFIKTDAPVITAVVVATVRPAPPWSATSKTIAGSTALLLKITATGGAVTYQYAIDGGLPSAATKNKVLTIPGNTMAEGPHTIVVMASDLVGNTGESAPIALTVDNTPPTAVVSGQPEGLNMAVAKTNITVSGNGVVFYRYKLRFTPAGSSLAGVWGKLSKDTPTVKPIAIAAKKSGLYELAVIGKDDAGNLQPESSATVVSWTVDSLAPVGVIATINGSVKPAPAANPVTLGLTYSGAPTEMSFSVDSITWSAWEAVATSKQYTVPGVPGKKKILARFRDEAGNISKVAKKPFVLLP